MDEDQSVVQVVMLDVLFDQFKGWLDSRGLLVFRIPQDPGEEDLPTYGVGPKRLVP